MDLVINVNEKGDSVMYIVKIFGGLGNQMFQYAFARALERETGYEVKLDNNWYDKNNIRNNTKRLYKINEFNINEKIASDKEIKNIKENKIFRRLRLNYNFKIPYYKKTDVIDKINGYNGRVFNMKDNKYFDGYWQSYKYFNDISDIIKREFTLKKEMDKTNLKISKQIQDTNSVSLHIRRGDYLKSDSHKVCDLEYYEEAIKFLKNKIRNIKIYVFSDDIKWAKKNLSSNHEFIDHNFGDDSYIDMILMSYCKYNIIANSTFSWWGAWLNDNSNKIVISPKSWISKKNASLEKDLLLPDWYKI